MPAGRPRQVTTYLADELTPQVDPAGRTLVYVSNQGGNRDLWRRPLGGGPARRLTHHSADDYDPAYSPDGEYIAFASNRLDAKGDLFVMRADGSEVERLTGRGTADRRPAWFPDGRRLAYSSGSTDQDAVHAFDLDTRKEQRLGGRDGFDPAVSPDGDFVLFTSLVSREEGSLPCLWVHRVADGVERPLHGCDRPEGFGAWARDEQGMVVVFSRFHDDTNMDGRVDLEDRPGLWTLRFEGWKSQHPATGPLVPLTAATGADISPTVHRDTVFYASRSGRDLDIWAVPIAGPPPVAGGQPAVARLVEKTTETLDGLFLLRRCAVQLAGGPGGERCILDEANMLLRAGQVRQATEVFQRLARDARDAAVRGRARLGGIAARACTRLPLGLGLSAREDLRPRARELLDDLAKVEAPEAERALLRADILRRVGRWEEALRELDVVLAHREAAAVAAGQVAAARRLEGEILETLGNREAALDAYTGVLQADASRQASVEATRRILALLKPGQGAGVSLGDRVEQLESLARSWPQLPLLRAKLRLAVGKLHHRMGRRRLARQAFRDVVRAHPQERNEVAEALLKLSEMAEEDGDISQALDHVNELLQRCEQRPGICRKARRRIRSLARNHAEDLVVKGETGMAIKVYRQLLAQEPDDLVAHRQLLALMAKHGRAAEAVARYRHMSEEQPADDLARYLYGLSLTYLDPPSRFDRAADAIQEALSEDPQLVFAHQTLGWIYEQQAGLESEQELLHRAAEEYDAALGLLDAGSHTRTEADLLLNLGNVHYALGNMRRAYAFYQRRRSSQVEFAVASRKLVFLEQFARAAFLSGVLDDATTGYREAIELAGELGAAGRLPWLNACLGATRQVAGDHQGALDAHRRACELYAGQERSDKLATCHRNVAYNLYQLGQYKEAMLEFSRARKLLERHGPGGEEDRQIAVSLEASASRAAFGFDHQAEMNFLSTYQARLYRRAGDLDRARSSLEEKVAMLRRRVAQQQRLDLRLDLAIAVNHLAMLALQQNEARKAATLFGEAARLARTVGDVPGTVINTLNRLDLVLAGRVDIPAGELLDDLNAARAQVDTSREPAPLERVQVLHALGVVSALAATQPGEEGRKAPAMQEPAPAASTPIAERIHATLAALDRSLLGMRRAVRELRDAYDLARKLDGRVGARHAVVAGWNLADVLQGLERPEEAKAVRAEVQEMVHRLALVELAWRLPVAAESPQERAVAALRLPPRVAATGAGLVAARDFDRLMEEQVGDALERGDAGTAWSWAETRLARRRLDRVQEDLMPVSGDDRTYLEGLEERAKRVRNVLAGLTPALGDAQLAEGRKQLDDALDAYVAYRENGGNPRPILRHLAAARVEPLSRIRKILEPGEVVLELAEAPGGAVVFLITSDAIRVHQTGVPGEQVRREARALRDDRTHRSALARARLSSWLLAPLRQELEKSESIVAVTDAYAVPIGVLVLGDQALIRRVPVVHIHTASDLPLMRARRNLNLERALWIGPRPTVEIAGRLERILGSLLIAPSTGDRKKLDRKTGAVIWRAGFNLDPWRPMRSALGPDPVVGSLGGLSLGRLSTMPLGSGIWILHASRSDAGIDALPMGLEIAMAGADVPTALVATAPVSPEMAQRIAMGVLERLDKRSPAEAFSLACGQVLEEASGAGDAGWRLLLGLSMRGDPGMDEAARERHAQRALGVAVQGAMAAFRQEQWSDALASFLEVRSLAVYLGRVAVLPKIDGGIVQSAFQLGEYRLAEKYEKRILDHAVQRKDGQAEARARRFLGILQSRDGRHQEAAGTLRQAVSAFDTLGDAAEAAETRATLALALDRAASYQESIDSALAAMGQFESLGDNRQVMRMLRMLGTTYLKRLNMAATATEWFSRALALTERMEADTDRGATLLDLARCEMAGGSYEKVLALCDQAERLFERLDDARGKAETALVRSQGLWYLGEYQRAFVAQRSALAYAEKARDLRLGIMARSQGGLINLNIGDLEAAERALGEALEHARAAQLADEEAVQLNNLGIVAREKGELDQALARFGQALAIDTRLKNALGRAYDLRNIGIVEQMQERWKPAREHLEEALRLTQSIGDRFNQVKVLQGIARLELARGKLRRAREHARQAFELSERLGLREVAWRALRTLGKIAGRLGNPEDALGWYRQSIDLVEVMRAGLRVESFRSGFLDNKYDLYEDTIHLLIEMGRPQQAMEYAERARARGFLDLLAGRRIRVGSEESRRVLERVHTLREEIARSSEWVRRSRGEEAVRANQALQRARREYLRSLERLDALQPGLADFIEVRPVTVDVIQESLPDDVALLVYYVTRRDVLGWVIRSDGMHVQSIPIARKRLTERLRRLRERIENFAPIDDALGRFYRDLVAPFEGQLEDAARIGVVPHGVLHQLPFAALRLDAYSYWSDRVVLFMAPSVHVLHQLLKRQQNRLGPMGGLVALGDPERGDTERALPFARKEVEALGYEQVGSEVYTGAEASEALLRRGAGTAAYVHLACHARFDRHSPLKSELLLAPGEGQDGDLTALEIFSIPLRARLVTLSACQTGPGKHAGKDAMFGFDRAFLASGAEGVLASLWRVNDVATAMLMKRFYRYLKTKSPAVALRQAQRTTRRYFPHPAYWAGFVLFGSWR